MGADNQDRRSAESDHGRTAFQSTVAATGGPHERQAADRAGTTPAEDDASPRRGQLIDRYLILDTLGAGGMGVVVSAYDPDLDRKVAIKLIRSDLAGAANEESRQRLLREARAMARLNHPNVVTVFDVGTVGEQVFVAMELVEGTLEQWLATGHHSWQEIVEIFRQAGQGLGAAHDAGMIHRDFKPSNVLVGEDSRVLVSDFGLVASIQGDPPRQTPRPPPTETTSPTDDPQGSVDPALPLAGHLTTPGTLLGTPAYMAPEQHAAATADERADQFAFCISLYQALYGQAPFAGDSYAELSQAVLGGELRPPPDPAGAPEWLWPVVRRGLALAPGDRFPDMDALLVKFDNDPTASHRRQLVIDALCEFGRARARGGDPDTAATALRDALTAAMAARDQRRVAEAAISLALVVGHSLRRTDEGLELVAQAHDALEQIAGDPLLEGRLDNAHGLILSSASRYDEACAALERSVTQFETALGSDHTEVLTPLTNLGNALRTQGDLPRSALVLERAIRLARATAPDSRELSNALHGAGVTLHALGQAARAQELFDQALDLRQRLLGRDHPLVAETHSHLGWLLRERGHFEEAAEHHERTVAIFAATLGPRHPDMASALNNLGLLLLDIGRVDEAWQQCEHALALAEAALGADHEDTADCVENLGCILNRRGEVERALGHFQRALEIRKRALGSDHLTVATSHNNIGAALASLGCWDGGQQHYQTALRLWERHLGPNHPDVADGLGNLAMLLVGQRRPGEAIGLLERALAIRQRSFEPTHPDVALSHSTLGDALSELGRFDEALQHHRQALAIREELFDDGHATIAQSLTGLGECHLAQGGAAAAIDVLRRAADIRKQADIDPVDRGLTLFLLARALWKAGNRSRARAAASEAHAQLETAGPRAREAVEEVAGWLAQTK